VRKVDIVRMESIELEDPYKESEGNEKEKENPYPQPQNE